MIDRYTALTAFMASGAAWLGLYAAFGQPILIGVGLLCLALVGYGAAAEWRARRRAGRYGVES